MADNLSPSVESLCNLVKDKTESVCSSLTNSVGTVAAMARNARNRKNNKDNCAKKHNENNNYSKNNEDNKTRERHWQIQQSLAALNEHNAKHHSYFCYIFDIFVIFKGAPFPSLP